MLFFYLNGAIIKMQIYLVGILYIDIIIKSHKKTGLRDCGTFYITLVYQPILINISMNFNIMNFFIQIKYDLRDN